MVSEAIRAELKKLIEAEKFGVVELRALERVARQGRGLLLAVAGAPEKRKNGFYQEEGEGGLDLAAIDDNVQAGAGPLVGGSLGGAMSFGAQNETFGSDFMRNILAMYPQIIEAMKRPEPKPRANDLVDAITMAKEEGLDDIAELLTRRLKEAYADAPKPKLVAVPAGALPYGEIGSEK